MMKSAVDDDALVYALETAVNAKPSSQSGLMLVGGQVRQVYFAAIGKQRVMWRKAYCWSEAEAIEEADQFHHAAKHALAGVLRRQRERQLNITHWSEYLSHQALQHVMEALRQNPAGTSAERMKTLLRGRVTRKRLIASLTAAELATFNEALNIDLRVDQ
ncbi:MAG: hypothetical protein ABI583_09190 [Betaproteobacteria bacterium]